MAVTQSKQLSIIIPARHGSIEAITVMSSSIHLFQLLNSDVNKDLTLKAKDKDQTLKAKDQDKDQTYKDKDKDQTFKAKDQDKD